MRKLSRKLLPPYKDYFFVEGQALLIILLIMAVALTIGLSIVSRSITDIKISELSEEGARAFSAAEAGVEKALLTYTSGEGTIGEAEYEAKYETETTGIAEDETLFVFPEKVKINQPQTLYLAEYNPDDGSLSPYYTKGTIDVCWDGDAALEVGIYYQEEGNYKVKRYALDPDSGRRGINKFDPPDLGSCAGLSRKKTLDLPVNPLFLRLRVLYEDARVGVKAPGGTGGVLPSQGIKIESVGTAGEATRKVEVVKFHPAPPPFFDMVLYSKQDLKKE